MALHEFLQRTWKHDKSHQTLLPHVIMEVICAGVGESTNSVVSIHDRQQRIMPGDGGLLLGGTVNSLYDKLIYNFTDQEYK